MRGGEADWPARDGRQEGREGWTQKRLGAGGMKTSSMRLPTSGLPMTSDGCGLPCCAASSTLQVEPKSCGLSHAAILAATWMYGALSDSHASVWCIANVLQGALMLADPLLWPSSPALGMAGAGTGASPQEEDERAPPSSSPAPNALGGGGGMGKVVAASSTPSKAPKRRHNLYNKKLVPEGLDAIVIGSGIGGLSFASLMAKAGKKVLVLEKHYRPGGCTHAFTEVGDNAFDSGIHYVGGGPIMRGLLDHVVGEEAVVLAQMGSEDNGFLYDKCSSSPFLLPQLPMESHPNDRRPPFSSTNTVFSYLHSSLRPFTVSFASKRLMLHGRWEGGRGKGRVGRLQSTLSRFTSTKTVSSCQSPTSSRFDLGGGPDNMIEFKAGRNALVQELVARYPHEEKGIRSYMRAVEFDASLGTNALMASKFVPPRMPFHKQISRWLAGLSWTLGRRTAKEVVEEHVKDPELRALLSGGQLIDWNLSPDKVPRYPPDSYESLLTSCPRARLSLLL